MSPKNCCCICLNDNNNDMMITKCNHHIHKNCLTKWLNINCSCPMCRTKINPMDYNINIPNKINAIDIPNNNGITPLMMCAINGNIETLKVLINLGANVSIKVNNKSAIDYALEYNRVTIINYFNTL